MRRGREFGDAHARRAGRGRFATTWWRVVAVALPLGVAAGTTAGMAACASAPRRGGRAGAVPDSARGVNILTNRDYDAQPVGRIEELFTRVPGVRVGRRADGQPSISIRGGGDGLLYVSEPLIVLDGFPLSSGVAALAGIAPRDVERIEVLKDPAELAAWGSRGGSGVILIRTKRPPRPEPD